MRGLASFAAGAVLALAAGWAGFPHVIYRSAAQPVDFNHKVHADSGATCQDCHPFRTDGTFAGLPALDKCAGCHAAPMGTTAVEKRFIDDYVTPNRQPRWLSYSRQPENVYFSHAAHVQRGRLKCEERHGNEGATTTPRLYQEDRISGYSREIWRAALRPKGGMTMDDCVACHSRHNLTHACLDCHK
jgi:hypothetical protein